MSDQLQNALQGNFVTWVAFALGGIYVLISFAKWMANHFRQSAMIKKHGCKLPKKYPHKDPIFGLDVFLENVKFSRDGGFLEQSRNRFRRLECRTFLQLMLGRTLIQTCEPENIKA